MDTKLFLCFSSGRRREWLLQGIGHPRLLCFLHRHTLRVECVGACHQPAVCDEEKGELVTSLQFAMKKKVGDLYNALGSLGQPCVCVRARACVCV